MAGIRKISISMPEEDYKALEAARRKGKRTRSRLIRDALAAAGIGEAAGTDLERRSARGGAAVEPARVAEDRVSYGETSPAGLVDVKDLRRRAIAAAGRFASGVPDLSIAHDAYLAAPEPDAEGEATGAVPSRHPASKGRPRT